MTAVVIMFAGTAGVDPGDSGPVPPGSYLREYDPEFAGGRGLAHWTADIRDAMVFPSFVAAFELWRSSPKSRPLRPDGKPNRPLTAFSCTFPDAPAGAAVSS